MAEGTEFPGQNVDAADVLNEAVRDRDPELAAVLQRVVTVDLPAIGTLDARTRDLIAITVLVTRQALLQLAEHIPGALAHGLAPLEIREVIYQCAPFVGFPAVCSAVEIVDDVFEAAGIELPLPSAATTTDESRFERGREIQERLYGRAIRAVLDPLPDGLGPAMADLLTDAFGDFYTRDGLDVATRELLVLCMFVALGDMPNQIRSHSLGNLKVGNSKARIVAAMVACYPYVGFPRVLNAVRLILDLPDGAGELTP